MEEKNKNLLVTNDNLRMTEYKDEDIKNLIYTVSNK